jgi:hypothetical protein
MKNQLNMVIFSRRPLCTGQSAAEQIRAFSEFRGGLMCPDKWGEFEPLKKAFDPANIDEPTKALSRFQGLFLYRAGKPLHIEGAMWNLTLPPTSRFPSPLFANYWTGWFDGRWAERIGFETLEQFACKMFAVMSADFAFLTTHVDYDAKNRNSSSFSFKGMNLDIGLPGLYWINLFSSRFAKWLGVNEIHSSLAEVTQSPRDIVLLKFCQTPDLCRSYDVLKRQRAVVDWLGAEKFFDIQSPERKPTGLDWGGIPFIEGM